MTVFDDQAAAHARTPQDILEVGVRRCANWYATRVRLEIWATELFDSAGVWSKPAGTTVTANTDEAPDGNTTADTLAFAAAGDYISTPSVVNTAPSNAYTGSVWIKAGSAGTITIDIHDTGVTEIGTAQVNVTTSWQRFWLAKLFTAGAAAGPAYLRIRRQAGDLASVIAWGANLYKNPVAEERIIKFPYLADVATVPAPDVSSCNIADAGDGARCFYSYPTCQTPSTFNPGNSYEEAGLDGIRRFRFCRGDLPLPVPGEDIAPMLRSISHAAQEIDIERAVTVNERAAFLLDDDAGPGTWDPDKANEGALINTARGAGTFWRRFIAIYRNYANPAGYLRWLTGFVASGMTLDLFAQRGRYIIRNIKLEAGGRVTIEAADRLKLLRKKLPAKVGDDNTLTAALTDVATTVYVANSSEVTLPGPGYTVTILIDSEKMNVTAVDEIANALTVTRGRWGTTAAAHAVGAAWAEVTEFGTERSTPSLTPLGKNPIDIVVELLRRGGIDAADIDTTAFEAERDTWLPSSVDTSTGATSGTLFRRTVDEQTDIETLIREIREALQLFVWIGEDQLVTGKLFAPVLPTETLTRLTDAENIVAETLEVDDNDESRITRVIIGWDLDADGDPETLEDYLKRLARIGAAEESASAYGESRTKVIMSQWLQPGAQALAGRIAIRILGRFRRGARLIRFRLELKDDPGVALGQFIEVDTALIEAAGGADAGPRIMQITRKRRREDGRFDVTALDTGILKRYAFVGATGLPDYDSATDAQKRYGYIGDGENKVGALVEDGYYIW